MVTIYLNLDIDLKKISGSGMFTSNEVESSSRLIWSKEENG